MKQVLAFTVLTFFQLCLHIIMSYSVCCLCLSHRLSPLSPQASMWAAFMLSARSSIGWSLSTIQWVLHTHTHTPQDNNVNDLKWTLIMYLLCVCACNYVGRGGECGQNWAHHRHRWYGWLLDLWDLAWPVENLQVRKTTVRLDSVRRLLTWMSRHSTLPCPHPHCVAPGLLGLHSTALRCMGVNEECARHFWNSAESAQPTNTWYIK